MLSLRLKGFKAALKRRFPFKGRPASEAVSPLSSSFSLPGIALLANPEMRLISPLL